MFKLAHFEVNGNYTTTTTTTTTTKLSDVVFCGHATVDNVVQLRQQALVMERFQSLRSSPAFITFVIAYAVYADQFLYAAVVPVIPFSLDKQVREDRIQFWTSVLLGAFGIGTFATSIPWGLYTDRSTSRRKPFLLGLWILLAATLLLWAAPFTHKASLALQLLARLVQGLASTIVWTTGLAVMVDAVGQSRIGECSGYVGIALNAGSVTAPLLGGIIFATRGYHAVFGLIMAVIAVDFLLRFIMKEKSAPGRPNARSCRLSTPEPGPGNNRAGKDKSSVHNIFGSASTPPGESLTPSVGKHRRPAMFRLLSSMRMAVALWGILVLSTVYSGFEAILPLTVHAVFDWNATGAGLIFLPLSLPALFGPLVGRITDRVGGRWFVATAFLLLCPSLVLLRVVDRNSVGKKIILCVLLVCIGCCLTTILEPLFAEMTLRATTLEAEDAEALPMERSNLRSYYAQAYSLFNMAWALGDTVGPFLAGTLVESAGWKMATLCLGVLCGVSSIPIVLWCDGWIQRSKQ